MLFPKKKQIKSKLAYINYKKNHLFCEHPDCNKPIWFGPHHIIFRSQGGSDIDENLIALCKNHHDLAHGTESRKVREFYIKLKSSQ